MSFLKRIGVTMSLAALASIGGAAVAADYPSKPVTLVVPYGPGGAADLAARTLSTEAPEYLGENILVVNKTGAGGVVGSTQVAKSRNDGHTLLMARVGSQATVPAINRTIPYKWDDFTFLGLIEKNPFVLGVSADSPYQTFDELKEAITNGERLSYASAGVGTLLHMAMLIMLDDIGVDSEALIHVPFKGGGKATAAVVGGHADLIFHNLSGLSGAIESGQIRPLLTTTPERFATIPDTPTAQEMGHPNLENVIGWTGVWGPKDLPEDVVAKWVEVLGAIAADESWLEATQKLGSVPAILSPDDTKAFVEGQVNTFSTVAEKLNMVIE
ncbi:tripartite tricarboxylate transporter substrate binding protein [Ruegeria sp. 2205SS24-7]|uniref:Bug family tripartite tricarboxylate transporter substrate binding protein n=1 Tax=Ruegeria discodermiae TaxID=3064389 RepID=UPI0027425C3F|nr:tripartite tricarboxylate transporter substrate binding protein [Ruegeria sp. 2205SS24-7]MDP5218441.1 tripartite tricarboxylate transporter substrate binding protein [Ruegeria sp. 2205SS24-7]